MSYEIKPGQGTVWKSEPGKPSVYSGKGKDPSGADVWIDLYVVTDKETGEPRQDKNGNPFFNVRLKQRDGAGGGYGGGQSSQGIDLDLGGATKPMATHSTDELDDEIPF